MLTSYFQGLYIYKYGVERRQALSLEAALVTPVTPRVISNPRVQRVKHIFIFDVSAEVTRYSIYWFLAFDLGSGPIMSAATTVHGSSIILFPSSPT